jgi:hypothetical protein
MELIITTGNIQSFENSPWEFRNKKRNVSSVVVVISLFLIQLLKDVMKGMCVCVDFMLLSIEFNFENNSDCTIASQDPGICNIHEILLLEALKCLFGVLC